MLRRETDSFGISFLRLSYLSVALVLVCLLTGVSTGQMQAQKVTLAPDIVAAAGDLTQGYAGDNGPATSAEISDPAGMAFDSAGNLYFAEYGGEHVRRVSASGTITTVAGNGIQGYNGDNIPALSAEFFSPLGVAVDAAGNLYIADYGNERIRKVDTSGNITTVAGTGTYGYNGDNIPATSAQLAGPAGVTFDSAGNLYIAEWCNNRIRKVDATGTITTVAGNGQSGGYACTGGYNGDNMPATSAQLNSPVSVAFDNAGNLYIADLNNFRVRKVDTSGNITTVAGGGTYGYEEDNIPATTAAIVPWSVATDNSGNLYIADNGARVRMVNTGGFINTVAGGGGGCGEETDFAGDGCQATNAWFNGADDVALDNFGNLYIADQANQLVRKLTSGQGPTDFVWTNINASRTENVSLLINTALTLASTQTSGDFSVLSNSCALNTPLSAGTTCTLQVQFTPTQPGQRWFPLIVTDSNSNNYSFGLEGGGMGSALAFTPGIIITVAGNGTQAYAGDNGPAISAEIYSVTSVTVDSAGNFYIADEMNNRVRKVDINGIITTVAGNGIQGYGGDGGPATGAQLNHPTGVRLDSAGNLYIAEYLGNRIRKVDVNGIITTVAGNGGCCYSGDGGPAINAELNYPSDVAVDINGNLYIADVDNERVRKVDVNGIITTFAGNGNQGYSGDGGPATQAELSEPDSVEVGPWGALYILDYGNSAVRVVNSAGVITTVAGTGVRGYTADGGQAIASELDIPQGLAVDTAGDFYIAETGSDRVRKVDVNGILTTVAGNSNCSVGYCFSGDGGSATIAELNGPGGVAVDSAGNLYITDNVNARIRKVNVATSALSFGALNLDQISSPQSVDVSDVGNAALNISTLAVSSNYGLQGVGNDCVPGEPLSIGFTCAVGVVFAPSVVGNPLTGTLVITDDAFNSPQSSTLSGIGNPAQVVPTLIWPTPAAIIYGTPLSATQLDATSGGVAGTFLYTPGAGAVLAAGPQTLWVTFSPTNTTAYTSATTSVALTVADEPLTVSPNSYTRAVGTANPTLAGTVTGAVNNDLTTGNLIVNYSTTAGTASPIGQYPITATISGQAASNYSVTVNPGMLTVGAAGVDMIESGVTAPAATTSGSTIQVTDTATDQGVQAAAATSTWFYLATSVTAQSGTYLGSRSVPSLVAGGSNTATSTQLTLPAGIAGTYYIVACANAGYTPIKESNTTNNCSASAAITLASADLDETAVSVTGSLASGGAIQVTDTVSNLVGVAPVSTTWFYLATSATAQSGTYLGSRSVPSLTAPNSNTATTSLTLPTGIAGTYYIVACANAGYSPFTESNRTNNCFGSAAITVASADLDETAVSVTGSLVAGGVIHVTDTVSNLAGVAPVSTTWFYLTTSATAQSGTYLGSRSVPSLTAPNSNTATTSLTLPTGIAGTYYIVACANAGYSPFTESNRTNNCLGSAALAIIP